MKRSLKFRHYMVEMISSRVLSDDGPDHGFSVKTLTSPSNHLVKSVSIVGHKVSQDYKSLVVRKPAFRICENKDADQLRGDQRLCFRHTDSAIPLLSKSEISSLQPSSVAVQPGLCQTWSETPKTGFLTMRLISYPLSTR